MSALEFIQLLASVYKEKADDDVISVGHWSEPEEIGLPRFSADIAVRIEEIRQMAAVE